MQKYFYLAGLASAIFLFSDSNASAQTNLVFNPSFEDTVSCPTNSSQINYANGWGSYSLTPDYFNSCSAYTSTVSVPTNFAGYQQPFQGEAYSGFIAYGSQLPDLREFIGGNLSGPLSIGTKYYISLKVSLALNPPLFNCSCNNIGVLLSTNAYGSCNGCLPIPKNPHLNMTSKITDSLNWTLIMGSFVADSNYTHVIIGNFFKNNNTDTLIMDTSVKCGYAYYYLDELCISTDSLTCYDQIGIETFYSANDEIKVYPNPAQNKAFYEINLKNEESGFVLLFDVLGKQIDEQKLIPGANLAVFDLTNVTGGIYFYKVLINAEIKSNNKLIIAK